MARRCPYPTSIHCRLPRPGACLRLVCFHWAGGGAMPIVNWAHQLPEHIEVVGIRLPGREMRMREAAAEDMMDCRAEAVGAIMDHLADKPFMFLGHSMGGSVAFETARYLRENCSLQPTHLFISSKSPPNAEKLRNDIQSGNITKYWEMSTSEIKDQLLSDGITPKEVLENTALLELFIPTLKTDLKATMLYRYERKKGAPPPLSCPITVFYGEDDTRVFEVDKWQELTSGTFAKYLVPGGHFHLFSTENKDAIHKCIIEQST